jgi:hypothetical protein
MPSTAISAQGSTFQIETGSGGAKTITAIALGYPTILTSAAHGFSNGDVQTLSGLTGTDAALLNGQSLTVFNKTTNTWAVNVDTTGKTITAAGSATPVLYTTIGNVKSYNGFDGSASEIDVTNLSSLAKEKRLGLQDFGKFSTAINPDFADNGQNAMRAAKATGAQKNFKWNYPNGKVASFAGYVKSMPESGGVDGVIDGSTEITITGAVIVA